MNYLIKIGIIVLLACLSSFSFAEDSLAKEHIIASKALNEEQKITVFLPENYDKNPQRRYPVLYLLDGKYYKKFAQAVITAFYSDWLIPETIVVAIENEDRIRDYTPSPHETRKGTGGAGAFLEYLEKELLPFIDSHYQTSDFRILNGHSLGGLFSLYALHTRPRLFTAHFALSPSLHWGNKATVKNLKSYLSSQQELNQFLYINLGDEDGEMREGFLELQAFLAQTKPKGFRVKSELLESLSHGATHITGMVHATNELYRNWVLPFAAIEQGREGIAKHFQALSDDLYYEIKPRKSSVNYGADYMTLGLFKPDKGIDLLKYNAELYPESAWVQFNLAKGYKNIEQLEDAKIHAELALKHIGDNDVNDKDEEEDESDDEDKLKIAIPAFLHSLEDEKNQESESKK